MAGETRYGSSEYSSEAEELFAAYVLRRRSGEAVDFEALCAEHEGLADELYGLHTDWDNVSSLLGRLEGSREAPAASAIEAGSPEPPELPEAVPEGPVEPERTPSAAWKWLAVAGAAGGLVAAGVALSLFRDKGVLAQERLTLIGEKGALVEVQRELEARGEALSSELTAQRAETEREREAAESAREQARRESERSALLGARLAAGELLEEEATLRAIAPERLEAMEAWLARADALAKRAAELPSTDPALAADLERLAGPGGARWRVEARAALLRRVEAERTEADGRAWVEALAELADPTRSPAYAGAHLEPHFALVPLGREPLIGLWLFADRRTGEVASGDALVLLLHPGDPEAGVSPFFVATTELGAEHWERAGVPGALDELGYRTPTPEEVGLVGTASGPVLDSSGRRAGDGAPPTRTPASPPR